MESDNNKAEDIDPDYKINTIALRKIKEKEEEENKLTSEKISKIIAEEFDKELSVRQKQLEDIEDKICKAQKLLHLVRYVLITSYYNKKDLEYNSASAEFSSTSDFDVQNRIHPAVKKLLGKNASLEVLKSRGKRRACNKNNYNIETSHLSTTKKIKLEPRENCESFFKSQTIDNNQNLQKNRKKTRHRIVVGNISKWMPSLENDNTTHKWMVYVRGLKEAVDISNIVSKVTFYLHPSYKPHDIVEISSYPFHLSRRGWGEFPLRVQIFFKNPLNKPVSIVHNLKLDKTYTGRQTLGNETIVDVYLHDDDCHLQEPEKENCQNVKLTPGNASQNTIGSFDTFPNPESIKQETIIKDEVEESPNDTFKFVKGEPAEVKDEYNTPTDLTSTSSFEHNYCYEEEAIEENANLEIYFASNDLRLLDHTYSLPSNEYKQLNTSSEKTESAVLNEQQNNSLIFGLGETYAENDAKVGDTNNKKENMSTGVPVDKCLVKTFTTATGQPIRFLPQSFNKVLLSNGNIIQIQLVKSPQPQIKKIDCNSIFPRDTNTEDNVIDYEKYKLSLPKKCFKNLGEVLPYLFKRLPLWSDLASDIDFKCTYPFVATSFIEFSSWNIGRRINSEWCRAKAIKKILSTETFPDLEKWSTKTFFMYGRSHGYSSLIKYGTLFRQPSKDIDLLDTCFSKSLLKNKFSLKGGADSDDDIDITDPKPDDASELTSEKKDIVDISDTRLKYHCTFVKEAALDCGIILKPEEISEGVVMNAAERMILEAVKCFAEGLIRRSQHHSVCREDYSEETSEITVSDVKVALKTRPEVRSVMNFQKKKREMDFFS